MATTPLGAPTCYERLLYAAKSEFACSGFELTKINSIALRAGVSRAFIYKKFRNKENLYRFIRGRLETSFYENLICAAIDDFPPEQAMELMLIGIHDFHRHDPVLTAMMRDLFLRGLTLERDETTTRLLRDLRICVSRILERGRTAGVFDCNWDGGTYFAFSFFVIMGALHGAELIGPDHPGTVSRLSQQEVVALLLRTLQPHLFPVVASGPATGGAVMSQLSSGKDSVDRVLDAAERCFGEHGLAATHVRDVAVLAGVSIQLVYHYFPTKIDLHRTVIERRVVRNLETLLAHDPALMDPLPALRSYLELIWKLYASRPSSAKLTIELGFHNNAKVRWGSEGRVLKKRLLDRMDAILQQGITTGVIHPAVTIQTMRTLVLSLFPPVSVMHQTQSAEAAYRDQLGGTDISPGTLIEFTLRALVR